MFDGRSMGVQGVFEIHSLYSSVSGIVQKVFKDRSKVFEIHFSKVALRADEDRTTKNVDSAFVVTSA